MDQMAKAYNDDIEVWEKGLKNELRNRGLDLFLREYIILHAGGNTRKLVKACYNVRDKALISVFRRATGYEIKVQFNERRSDGNVYGRKGLRVFRLVD